MKYLVTGSTGFIGRRLCAILADRGDAVAVVKRGDDLHGIMAAARPDVVIHLAAAYVRDHEPLDVADLVQSNVEYGTHVLEAMRQCEVSRIVTASSLWAIPAPVNLYAATKLAFDAILDYYHEAYSFFTTTLLLGDTYGPEDRRGKIVYRMFEAIIRDEELRLTPGAQIMDLVHVDDVCAAFIHAAERPNLLRHHRWALHGERVNLKELAGMIEIATLKRLKAVWGALPYHPQQTMCPADAPNLPGWAPARTLTRWLAQLAKEI